MADGNDVDDGEGVAVKNIATCIVSVYTSTSGISSFFLFSFLFVCGDIGHMIINSFVATTKNEDTHKKNEQEEEEEFSMRCDVDASHAKSLVE